MMVTKLGLILATLVSLAASSDDCVPLEFCDGATNCALPDCACSKEEPNVPLDERPQIVYLTFDDAFRADIERDYYSKLFDGQYTNPNGCPIRATHFISARSNNYALVHQYRSMGHEIASHSITHRQDTKYWKELDEQGWVDEIGGMRRMLERYAKIAEGDIIGVRAPYLQGGGDVQFNMMKNQSFKYDCSMPNQENGYLNMADGIWPYSADHLSETQCQILPCPTCSHPGLWVQPMLDLEDARYGENPSDPNIGFQCAMLDSCEIPDPTKDKVYDMLFKNFDRAYTGNTRAPFGLYVHASWFLRDPAYFAGYEEFIKEITSYEDVWIVPIEAGLEYRKDPMNNEDLTDGYLDAFNCDPGNFPDNDCTARTCCYENVVTEDFNTFQEYIEVCDACPLHYPWLGDPEGQFGNDDRCGQQ